MGETVVGSLSFFFRCCCALPAASCGARLPLTHLPFLFCSCSFPQVALAGGLTYIPEGLPGVFDKGGVSQQRLGWVNCLYYFACFFAC